METRVKAKLIKELAICLAANEIGKKNGRCMDGDMFISLTFMSESELRQLLNKAGIKNDHIK